MVTVNIHEAKTQLSRLIAQAARGEAFVIAKAGKPIVKVAALDAPALPQRLGFMKGEIAVPDDFNHMGEREIARLQRLGSHGETSGEGRDLGERPLPSLELT